MSQKAHRGSAIRPPHWFHRLFPAFHFRSPASASSLPLPSNQLSLPSSGHHDADHSSATSHCLPTTSSTMLHSNSVTPRPLPLHSRPTPLHSAPQIQLEHYASAHQAVDLVRLPSPRGLDCPPRPSSPHLDPYAIHSRLSSQLLHAPQSSNTIYPPEMPTYRTDSIHQQPLRPLQGQLAASQDPYNRSPGMFYGAHHFTIQSGTFGDTISDDFMEKLLRHTIIGAEYDSSDRHPPPRCHPGTRLAVVERCRAFIEECHGPEKTRWVVGPAGVGKSAIMQMVAEETPADASVFLSVNGRRDGTKTFNTIAYQLAAKYEPYRQFISKEINRDPTLLRKALPAQFQKLIVDPFIHKRLFSSSDRFLVIIDGLDECDNPFIQRELLKLISEFCLSYSTSPIVWFIASRPEPHITSFFDDERVAPTYTKEEIKIDSDEACEDVQRYLRDELNKIKCAYPTLKHKREWPSELEFTKIATAAGGLFAYAATVVRYIGDAHYGDPVSQLGDVLVAVDAAPKDNTLGRNNPLALLDALYARILSKIPGGVMINTRKLLLVHSDYASWPRDNFRKQCNRLGLTEDAAYGAVRHLHAVLKVPVPHEADEEPLTYFHKSFKDFLFDFNRSGFSPNIRNELDQLQARSSSQVVEQVPDIFDGIVCSEGVMCGNYGCLKSGPGVYDNISLSWPYDERFRTTDRKLKLILFCDAMRDVCNAFRLGMEGLWDLSGFHALTMHFVTLGPDFPIDFVRCSVFARFRSQLVGLGRLKMVPLRKVDYTVIRGKIESRCMSLVGEDDESSDSWNSTCLHLKCKEEEVDGLQNRRGWSTHFGPSLVGSRNTTSSRTNAPAGKEGRLSSDDDEAECLYCSRRFARHFIKNPNQLATVFVDSTGLWYVEVIFVGMDDGMAEWRYRFCCSGSG